MVVIVPVVVRESSEIVFAKLFHRFSAFIPQGLHGEIIRVFADYW